MKKPLVSIAFAFTLCASASATNHSMVTDSVAADNNLDAISDAVSAEKQLSADEDTRLTESEGLPKWATSPTGPGEKKLPLSLVMKSASAPTSAPKIDMDLFKMKTNPGVKPYRFLDDVSFVGIPLFIAGAAIKGEKKSFRQNYSDAQANTRLLKSFKTHIDDYTQFFGPAMTVGLKIGGVEGRSSWPRLLASAGLSYALMAGFVNNIKYTASEIRPDGSTANSWPSGHTATSFVGATLLHKEYGLTRSPWYSVAGYGVATATGVMRVLNNRHWVSDVLSGAGIGILSTELGYAIGDLLFKEKGLLRNDFEDTSENPSFFGISMGMSLGSKELEFLESDNVDNFSFFDDDQINSTACNVDFHTATSVDAEGAYFFNKYVGVGGRLRVRAMTAKDWKEDPNETDATYSGFMMSPLIYTLVTPETYPTMEEENAATRLEQGVQSCNYTIVSDHLTEFLASVGLYFNIPLSKRFALGTKALVGRSIMQDLEVDAHFKGKKFGINSHVEINDMNPFDTNIVLSNLKDEGEYDAQWPMLTLAGNSSSTLGTGLSLTYQYKSNFSWKLFVDYDYSRKTYTLTYDPLHYLEYVSGDMTAIYNLLGGETDPEVYRIKKNMHYFTIGGTFAINL